MRVMCDQRERLLDYLYDEGEAGGRRLIEAHLATCETCRDELGGLRRARQDLLAWDVPNHESVWKPFAPARVAPSWRDVPRWTLATAAGVMFLIGAAGGFAARAFAPVVASAEPVGVVPVVQAAAGAPDLTAMEQRILAQLRAERDQQVSLGPSRGAAPTQVSSEEFLARVQKLIASSEERQGRQLDTSVGGLWVDLSALKQNDQRRIDGLVNQMNRLGAQVTALSSQQTVR
jgi:hypothetical protein